MRRLSAFLFGLLLVGFVSPAPTHRETSAQQAPSARLLHASLEDPRVAVFDTNRDSCELIDIPDAPARAFRDAGGTIHLVSSHYILRASLGPTLETVKHNCRVAYDSRHDANPAHFDDSTWLDSFYSLDGQRIVALGHMEYHGWEHKGECKQQGSYTSACWYNADTFHVSEDGGYHFDSLDAPKNFAVGLPYRYEVNLGPEGYSVDTNIVKAGDWYYAMVTDWNWPPNCIESGPHPCLVPFGGSPIRTNDILDPASWRGWNGKEFSVSFVDPYSGPVTHPAEHIYTPVPWMYYVNAINIDETSHLFVATLCDPFNAAYGPEGIYLSTSPDLANWTTPILLVTMAQLRAKEPKGSWSYAYASLLDPSSTDSSFSTITDSPYLYYVRSDDNHPPYVRVLFRQPIMLTWK